MSIRQAEEVAARLDRLALRWNGAWDGGPAVVERSLRASVELERGMKVTLLSPRPQELARLAKYWQDYQRRGAPEPDETAPDETTPAAPAEETAAGAQATVLYVVSAQEDSRWRSQLQDALAPLIPSERIFWDAERPQDEAWRQSQRQAIERARVAVVLVSQAALASAFVQDEMTALIDAATRGRLALAWILLEPCNWESTPLARFQALHDVKRSLTELTRREATRLVTRVAESLVRLTNDQPAPPATSTPSQRSAASGPIDVEALAGRPFVADRSVANNASIAFLAEHDGKALLVSGDASPDVLAESIRTLISRRGVRRLRVDAFVVPRNGSAGNLHRELLELLDCDRYLIATNGERFLHPDRETIARILAFGRSDRDVPLTLVFNYRTPSTSVWGDPELQSRWKYRAIYPERDGGGIKVQI